MVSCVCVHFQLHAHTKDQVAVPFLLKNGCSRHTNSTTRSPGSTPGYGYTSGKREQDDHLKITRWSFEEKHKINKKILVTSWSASPGKHK